MSTTSLSLLDRLKRARPDDPDWLRLQQIYLPLIRRWIGQVPGLASEADDLTQEVLAVLAREISRFERQREGSFRTWLRRVTVNQIRYGRRQQRRRPVPGLDHLAEFLDQIADPNGELAREWDRDHDKHVVERLLAIVRPDFSATTWDAFLRFVLNGETVGVVASIIGISENAVILAKFRVLKRLREEAGELLG